MRTAEVRFTPMNGHRQTGPTGPFRAKLGHDANKKALKEKPPRRRLFNTGRCGVGQRFSHVYSRPTQPLQDSQRDRRNERPRSHHRVRLRRLRRSRARLRSLLRLTGALDVPASSANIRHARAHHQGAFARRHLVPADGSAGLAYGGSCHAHTVNSCPTSAAGGSDLRDHAVRLRNRRRRHSLCRYCNR